MGKHTILFLAANPSGTDPLALDREAHAIQVELERSRWRDCFEFVTRWAAEPLDLLRELRKLQPTVVHFSGHGGPSADGDPQSGPALSRDVIGDLGPPDSERCGGLFFQGANGGPRVVSAAALRDAFGATGSSVKLVVLNACYSEPAAEALLTYVDCVVGMAGSIRDATARNYVIGFYGGLGERDSIEAAHRGGCAAIGLEGLPEGDRPRLRVRQGVDVSRLILAEPDDAAHRSTFKRSEGEPIFTEREAQLGAIADGVQEARAAVLHGAPGLGRSWLVREHAHRHAEASIPLLVAAVTGLAGLGLLLLMLWNAQELVGLGLTGYVWYVLLLLLGLAAVVTVFSLFKSYARYTGKAPGGASGLGRPIVVMLLVIALGFYLAPAPVQPFDVTVFLHSEAGPQVAILRNSGRLSLDFGADRRTESVGDKGEVRFLGIPPNMRGRKIALALDDDNYELVNPSLELRPNQEVFYAAVRPKRLSLAGYVSDDRGRPLAQARASIAGNAATTDQDGRFEISLPADLSEGDRTIIITAPGYETWRAQAAPGGNSLQVRLSTSIDGR